MVVLSAAKSATMNVQSLTPRWIAMQLQGWCLPSLLLLIVHKMLQATACTRVHCASARLQA
jgi:hypothetical protein